MKCLTCEKEYTPLSFKEYMNVGNPLKDFEYFGVCKPCRDNEQREPSINMGHCKCISCRYSAPQTFCSDGCLNKWHEVNYPELLEESK